LGSPISSQGRKPPSPTSRFGPRPRRLIGDDGKRKQPQRRCMDCVQERQRQQQPVRMHAETCSVLEQWVVGRFYVKRTAVNGLIKGSVKIDGEVDAVDMSAFEER
jgi:hypothetical protein